MTIDTITPRSRRAWRIAAVVFALIASLALAVPAFAGTGPVTRYVDDDGPGGPDGCPSADAAAYTTIQAAIDDSGAGDTILVCPGEYVGGFSVDGSTAGHPDDLTIRAVEPWTADIVAVPVEFADNVIVVRGVSDTLIQWLEVVDPTDGPCDANVFTDTLVWIEDAPDTSIRANHLGVRGTDTIGDCGYRNGIVVIGSDRPVVAWNQIIDFQGYGIIVEDSDAADIHGNSARYFHAAEPATFNQAMGIRVDGSPSARVAGNVVRSLPSAGVTTPRLRNGISVQDGGDPRVILNRVWYTRFGLAVAADVAGGIVRENAIRHSESFGIYAEVATQGVRFARNIVRFGDGQGIQMSANTSGNVLRHNDARNNALTDCIDQSSGPANDWGDPTTNLGLDDSPDGVCVPSLP